MDTQTTEEKNLQELAAAFGENQVTDDEGKPVEEDSTTENTADPEEKSSAEETPTPEKAADSAPTAPKQEAADDENELGVDDAGKRYVPEKRFKDVYGKFKATERELSALREQLTQGNQLLESAKKPKDGVLPEPARQLDKADVLELKMTLPQFDPKPDENGNPTNPDYSPDLDELGYDIWKANPTISLVDAGKKAVRVAKQLGQRNADVRAEARQVKSLQSDQGITGRGGQRTESQPNPDDMTDQEMEAWLKANGQW